MSKQDRQGVRTPADIERKYNISEVRGLSQESSSAVRNIMPELALKIGRNELGTIVSMINASADVINLTSNRLSVESDNFKLSADGTVEATNAKIGNAKDGRSVEIGEGTVNIISPPEEFPEDDGGVNTYFLLMKFRVYNIFPEDEYKEYGIYVQGIKDLEGEGEEAKQFWNISSQLFIKEIPQESGEVE